ncbi:Hypothetical predicted protein [Marmota monax]|uniref:Uncharacterized protein n=1 Tax=Marmota monax TaxID=9995 RepID=A0A5E4D3C5_MARMO|nr:Hypothetical predicted protein [Marmota monax]
MDDGGGAFISWEALSLIKDLGKYLENCSPRREDLSSDMLNLIHKILNRLVPMVCSKILLRFIFFLLLLIPRKELIYSLKERHFSLSVLQTSKVSHVIISHWGK